MDADTLFRLANSAVLPAWLLLAIRPRWRHTQAVATGTQLALAAGYVTLFFRQFVNSSGDFSSLSAVAKLFENPWVLLGGWVHYLVFDLFVGAWLVRDADRFRIPHWQVVPCLALTLMLGPFGFLVYMLVRRTRAGWLPEAAPRPLPGSSL